MLLLLALIAACTSAPAPLPTPAVEPPPPTPEAAAYALARLPESASIAVPASARPNADEAPTSFGPAAPFVLMQHLGEVDVWAAPLPVDTNLFPSPQVGARTFGFYEPVGLTVSAGGGVLRFQRNASRANSWGYDREHLLVGVKAGSPAPADVTLTWPKATALERSYHFATSGHTPSAFALRTLTVGDESYTGVLLPAPGVAAWSVQVPAGAVLTTRATLLPPAVTAAVPSDGAHVRLEVVDGEAVTVLADQAVALGDWRDLRVDLSAYAGRRVVVRLVSDPAGTPDMDLAFFEDPTIYVPSAHPKRVVVAFLDTVRPDHLGMYGYTKHPTTPKLDAWAAGGLRMDQQRTIAPWTLPSARAALTGYQPESFYDVDTLATRAAKAGLYTRGIVANAYLSPVFDVDRGFADYTYDMLRPADEVVDAALETLARFPDRDVLLWVQFMEAHLPYSEPRAYQGLFAGDQPPGLKDVSRVELVKFHGDEPDFPAVRDYVSARYDQNLRVLDDEVSRLFDAVGDDAITLIFSDHGEELWDHGGFEHGHSFHDELLRVPMVVRGPGVPVGVVKAPTSLLDLTPTVLDLLKLPFPSDAPGRSVLAAGRGDAEAIAGLEARAQGFGRPLYGADGWGVVSGQHKWVARDGAQSVYALATDPAEARDVAATTDRAAYPKALSNALGREVPQVWRLTASPGPAGAAVTLTVSHPSGVKAAWTGYDPKGLYAGPQPEIHDGKMTLLLPPGVRAPTVIYVQPAGDATDAKGLTLAVEGGPSAGSWTSTGLTGADDGGRREALPEAGAWKLSVDLTWAPVPGGVAVSGTNAEVSDQLKALGYH